MRRPSAPWSAMRSGCGYCSSHSASRSPCSASRRAAIGCWRRPTRSAAPPDLALMLPERAQKPILNLLRDYAAVRIGPGVPDDPAKLARDVARSTELQNQLWQQAVTVTMAAAQTLPTYGFVGALNEMHNIHKSRLTALRYHVPRCVDGPGDRGGNGGHRIHRLLRRRPDSDVHHVADHRCGDPAGDRSRPSGERPDPSVRAGTDRHPTSDPTAASRARSCVLWPDSLRRLRPRMASRRALAARTEPQNPAKERT
jgi:hypothetical protein